MLAASPDEHLIALDLNIKHRDVTRARQLLTAAIAYIKTLPVARALDDVPFKLTLTDGAFVMGAHVFDGMVRAINVKHGDPQVVAYFRDDSFTRGDVGSCADFYVISHRGLVL
jgi:hypothetical protein